MLWSGDSFGNCRSSAGGGGFAGGFAGTFGGGLGGDLDLEWLK